MAAPIRHMSSCCKSILYCKSRRIYLELMRRCSIATSHKLALDSTVKQDLDDDRIRPKTHAGLRKFSKVSLPTKLNRSIETLMHKYPSNELKQHTQELQQYLWSRRKPVEDDELTHRARIEEAKGLQEENFADLEDEMQRDAVLNKVHRKVTGYLRATTYHWQPIDYNAYRCFTYMVARVGFDYSSLMRVFAEIKHLDSSFTPKRLYDSGSGVGTVAWAANETWKGSLEEHFCVDPSPDMNTISRLLMQEGREDKPTTFPNVYFRQFHPPSAERKYDLVVSAYTLNELPNQAERLKYLLNLWRKTDKYLVIVEVGTNAGFSLVSEAREFVLQLSDESVQSKLRGPVKQEDLAGYTIAPCPHDHVCPRLTMSSSKQTPCNFPASYTPLKALKVPSNKADALFSYAVLRKGVRDETVPQWPRVIRESTKAKERVHCRLCLPNGNLQHSVISKGKHGKVMLHCARATKWGDLLPVQPTEDSPGWMDTQGGTSLNTTHETHTEETNIQHTENKRGTMSERKHEDTRDSVQEREERIERDTAVEHSAEKDLYSQIDDNDDTEQTLVNTRRTMEHATQELAEMSGFSNNNKY